MRRCVWCRRERDISEFPKSRAVGALRGRSRYCSACHEDPIAPELQQMNQRWRLGVLEKRYAQPSLFPSLAERVLLREIEELRETLEAA